MNSLNQVNLTLLLFSLFTVKHFIVDYWLQNEYQWSNKGNYLHPGGVLHSALHGLATFIIFSFVHYETNNPILFAFILSTLDIFIHYHIDWIKTNVNRDLGYKQEHKGFWILLGIDQTLHFLTYIFLIYLNSAGIENGFFRTILTMMSFVSFILLCSLGISAIALLYDDFRNKHSKT